MRKFRHYSALCAGLLLGATLSTGALANEGGVLDGEALLVTSGDPGDPKYANAGENLRTGVGSIFVVFESTAPGGFLCTASAIGDRHVLTAAHCLRNTLPDGTPDLMTRLVVVLPSGVSYILDSNAGAVAGFAVHPFFDILSPVVGAFAPGDIAVIEMADDLPADVERYDLYTSGDEFNKETRHYGHGRSGKGNQGATGGSDFFFARTGLNMYEQTLMPFFGSPLFDQLLHDFDSGGRKHNAMEWWFTSSFACHPDNPNNPPQAQDGQCTTFKDGSYPDFKGFEKFEVGVAPGDSGGPGFVDGKIAGVHSFGFTHVCAGITNGTDFSCGLNSSYGEMSGDTRVSSYASWVEAVAGGDIPTTSVPENAPAASAAQQDVVTISDRARAFTGGVLSRRLTKTVSLDEAREQLGLK